MRPRPLRAAQFLRLAILVTGLVSIPHLARAQTRHHVVNFSFFYPLATNRTPDVSANFRLGIFYGRLAEVRGLDISAVVARTDRDFRGLQVAGVTAYTGGTFRGISLVGGVNVLEGVGRGIQVTGGATFDRNEFHGGQLSGLLNFVGEEFTGIQLCSVLNVCDGNVRGVQISSLANTAGGEVTGVQLAGFNLAADSLSGAQIGFCNAARRVGGFQLALLNFAGDVDGAQIGIWNQARHVDGAMFGAVNLASANGYKGWVTYFSSYSLINTGLYSGVNGWYSMLTLGVNDLEDERGGTIFLSAHSGHEFDVHAPWKIAGDVGFVHVMPQTSDDPTINDRLHFALQARLLVERSFADRWRAFAGGGVNVVWNEYSKQATPDTGPLAVAGVIFE